jgi:1-aminocyclopropane-1-carboxylate deaminase/D-cysteine desulfhydrase-like pyridoxal-dependent ACC family enzyme
VTAPVLDLDALTPVEERNGRWYKREDHYALPSGVNGAKLRACQFLIGQGAAAGKTKVISAASILSPQSAMAAAVARQYGMTPWIILGATKAETAIRQGSVQIAASMDADFEIVPVGFNPYLQRAALKRLQKRPDAYWLRYGITTPADASTEELRAFVNVGAPQTRNLPDAVRTLVVPFGSANTATGVMAGLAQARPKNLERVVLVGIGPDRRQWMQDRLDRLGVTVPVPVEHHDLHGTGFARYGDKMPGQADGIELHPTYEGKVVRYLDREQPAWWTARDGSTCLWIVGGPLPKPARPGDSPAMRVVAQGAPE